MVKFVNVFFFKEKFKLSNVMNFDREICSNVTNFDREICLYMCYINN